MTSYKYIYKIYFKFISNPIFINTIPFPYWELSIVTNDISTSNVFGVDAYSVPNQYKRWDLDKKDGVVAYSTFN